jgi:hypothetical protein
MRGAAQASRTRPHRCARTRRAPSSRPRAAGFRSRREAGARAGACARLENGACGPSPPGRHWPLRVPRRARPAGGRPAPSTGRRAIAVRGQAAAPTWRRGGPAPVFGTAPSSRGRARGTRRARARRWPYASPGPRGAARSARRHSLLIDDRCAISGQLESHADITFRLRAGSWRGRTRRLLPADGQNDWRPAD